MVGSESVVLAAVYWTGWVIAGPTAVDFPEGHVADRHRDVERSENDCVAVS